jgi:hypothetical protein
VNIGNAPFPVALLKRGNDRSLQALIGGAVLHNLNIALEGKINFGKGHPQRPPLAKRRRSLLMGIVFPQRTFVMARLSCRVLIYVQNVTL